MKRDDLDPAVGALVHTTRRESIYIRDVIGVVEVVRPHSLTIADRKGGKIAVKRLKHRGFADVTVLDARAVALVAWWDRKPASTSRVRVGEPNHKSILTADPVVSVYAAYEIIDTSALAAYRDDCAAVLAWLAERPTKET